MIEIYLAKNHLLLKSGYGNPEMHSHSACHIIIGLEGDMKVCVNGKSVVCGGALLPSGVSHTVNGFGRSLLVFMFNITSKVSECIKNLKILETQEAEQIISAWRSWDGGKNGAGYEDFLAEVMAALDISETGSRVSDERIIAAMHFVKEHLNDDVTVRNVAESVYLSEGRFPICSGKRQGLRFRDIW